MLCKILKFLIILKKEPAVLLCTLQIISPVLRKELTVSAPGPPYMSVWKEPDTIYSWFWQLWIVQGQRVEVSKFESLGSSQALISPPLKLVAVPHNRNIKNRKSISNLLSQKLSEWLWVSQAPSASSFMK